MEVKNKKDIPECMRDQINAFVESGLVKVIRPNKHKQSGKAFPRGGRGSIWYDKQIKGNK